ncbi:MAG TPA: hypothetical protein VEY33_02295 [Gemmatimonadota bacterium]|nr:hypothetical protein [Gemmatimonadota bacterium]
MDTDSVAEPAVPAETITLVVYVPAVMPLRWAESDRVSLDLPAREPDVAPSESQLAFSLAVHDSEASPVFVSVIELVVALLPKSTWSGETESWPSEVPVEEGTVSDTDTVSEPAPWSPETDTFVLYVPAASDPRCAESEIVRVEFPHRVPDVASSDSQPALSLADQDNALLVVFVSVTDAVLPLLPKSTWSGATSSLVGLPASESTSVGEEEVHAVAATMHSVARAACRTRIRMGSTASLPVDCVGLVEAKRGLRLPDHQVCG